MMEVGEDNGGGGEEGIGNGTLLMMLGAEKEAI